MTSLPKSLADQWDSERITAETDPGINALEMQRLAAQGSARPPQLAPIGGGMPEAMPQMQAPVEDNTPADWGQAVPTMADLGYPDAPPPVQGSPQQPMSAPAGESGTAMPMPTGSAPASYSGPSQPAGDGEIEQYIRQAAAKRGIDPDIAVAVANSEGGVTEPARRGTFNTGSSWWPFQLHYGGAGYESLGDTAGMGNSFTAKTGIAPGDPNGWKQSVDYALDAAKTSGWGAWYGAKAIGVTGFQGIGQPGSAAMLADNAPEGDMQKVHTTPQGTFKGMTYEQVQADPSLQDGSHAQLDTSGSTPARDDWRNYESVDPQPGTPTGINNPDGSVTTERSITVTEPDLNDGRPTNIPTVWNGRVVSDDEAIDNAIKSGRQFQSYPNIDIADLRAEERSQDLGTGAKTSIGGYRVPQPSTVNGPGWHDTADQPPDSSASPSVGAVDAPGGDAGSSPPVEQPKPLHQQVAEGFSRFGQWLGNIMSGGDQNTAPEAPQRPATPENFNLPAAEHAAQNAASVLPDASLSGMQAANAGFEQARQAPISMANTMREEQDASTARQNELFRKQIDRTITPDEEDELANLMGKDAANTFAGGLETTAGKAASTAGRAVPEMASGIVSGARDLNAEMDAARASGDTDRLRALYEESLGSPKKAGWTSFSDALASEPAPAAAPQEVRPSVPATASDAQGSDRYYHGTGSDFTRLEARYNGQNGLYGDGPAYMTNDPRVAGGVVSDTGEVVSKPGYAQKRAGDAESGANIRPIDVPRDLNLIDADALAPRELIDKITGVLDNPNNYYDSGYFDPRSNATGHDVWKELVRTISQGEGFADKDGANEILAELGYDGIKYQGGNRVPMKDAAGAAIQHDVVAVFPESLDKIRNATAGTPGGFLPETPSPRGSAQAVDQSMARLGVQGLQGAVEGAGGVYQDDPNASPVDYGKGIIGGAARKMAQGALRSRMGPGASGALARAVGQATRAGRATGEGLPIELTDAQEAKRINIDKLVPQGVDQSVKDLILNNAHSADWYHNQRRGVRPDDLVAHDAQAINEAKAVDDWIAGGKAGKSYNPEETVALRNAYLTQAATVDDLGKQLKEPLTDTARDQKMAEYLNESTKLRGLAEVAEGARAEAGRTLRQYGEWGKLLEADPTLHARRYLDKMFGGTDGAQEVLKNYQQMQMDGASPQALAGFLRQTGNPSFLKRNLNRLQIVRYANMLSGTLTHIINTEGTLLNAAAEAGPVKVGAVAIDEARSLLTGKDREVFAGEILPQLRGGLAGTLEGLRQIPDILKTGVTMDEATKLEHLHQGFASGNAVVDSAIEMPLRLLQAEDAFTKSISRGGHLAELATRQALKEGLKGSEVESRMRGLLSDPVTNWKLFEQANELATRDAFQETRPLTTWLSQGKNLGGTVGALFNTIMPFTKTPTNIAAQGLGYTPLGFLDVLKSARAGNTGEAEMAASRAMLGTGLTGLGVNLATSGYLTGDYPTGPERDTLPNGWKPWSVRIPRADGSTMYVNYSNMGPLGIPLAIGAITGDAMKRGDDPMSWIPQAAVGTGKFMTDSTFLQGLSQLTAALQNPGTRAENFTEGIATQWMPAAAMQREIANALGMAQRDPHGAVEALLATSPLTANQVPARQDRLGRDVLPTQTGAGAVIAPARYGVSQPDPTLDTFRNAGVGLPAPPKKMDGFDLNRSEQAQYQRIFGDELQKIVSRSAGTGSLNRANPKVQQDILEGYKNDARDNAEARMIRDVLGHDEYKRRVKESALAGAQK